MLNKILSMFLILAGVIMMLFGSQLRPDLTQYQTLVIGMLFIIQGNIVRIISILENRG